MIRAFRFSTIAVFLLFGCSKNPTNDVLVTSPVLSNPTTLVQLGEKNAPYEIIGSESLSSQLRSKAAFRVGTKEAEKFLNSVAIEGTLESTGTDFQDTAAESLLLGFPKGLLGEEQLFGGVITKVSDRESETLGRLKLSDIPPANVRPKVVKDGKRFGLVLFGCDEKCAEGAEIKQLLEIPVTAIDEAKGLIYVDLSAIGKKLNLVEMMDPLGQYTKLKTKTAKTVAFDYSTATLVFDVEVTMVPILGAQDKETVFTARWYLRLSSVFNSDFVQRTETKGVGFFMTERSLIPLIQRWALPPKNAVEGTVKYFIKNVPDVFKPAFRSAMEEWNDSFKSTIGRKLLSYEFVDEGDPRAANLIAGDVRYNILEWDTVNRAPYGGLGPSIANQMTGQMLSANTLVQGPHIVKLYTEWFQASEKADELRAKGEVEASEKLLKDTALHLRAQVMKGTETKFALNLGSHLNFRIRSQEPSLEDPAMQRNDFEPIPKGFTYDTYMQGYFHDLVTHELGHNLGLRHNFRGNLSAADGEPQLGKVSGSIMEYLGRGFRHLDHVGEYDRMALAYGYSGKLPAVLNAFCTDEHVAEGSDLKNSAECSRDDATSDPFGFFESRLKRAIDLLVARGQKNAPVWKVEDMERELGVALTGLGLYGATALNTANQWTNFFNKADRPKIPAEVREYSVRSILRQVCDNGLVEAALEKESDAAKQVTLDNLKALRAKTTELLGKAQFEAEEIACKQSLDE